MSLSKVLKVRYLAILLLALVLAASVYAFAAANVVPQSAAGDGEKTISGYTVTNVHYVLDTTNPANIASVEFDIAATVSAGEAKAPASVSIQLLTGGTWFGCTAGTSPKWSCAITGVTALAANNLRVVAAQ